MRASLFHRPYSWNPDGPRDVGRTMEATLSDDSLFSALLTTLAISGVAFATWLAVTPPSERVELVDAPVVTALVAGLPRIPIPEPVFVRAEPLPDGGVVDRRPSAPAPRKGRGRPAEAGPARKGELALAILGTDGASGTLSELLGPDDPDLDRVRAALDTVHADHLASAGTIARGVRRAAERAVAVEEAGLGKDGVSLGRTVVRLVDSVEIAPEPPVTEGGDPDLIGKVVRGNRGRIETCVEQSLKRDASVGGRIGVGWTIRAGRVVGARLTDNTTGDAELGVCVVRAVRGITFPADMDAEVTEFPWVVSAR